MDIKLLHFEIVKPFAALGLTGPFWEIHSETILHTWIAMLIVFAIVGIFRLTMDNRRSLWFGVLDMAVEMFASFCTETIGYFRYDYFVFMVSLFVYVFSLCLVGLLPYCEEATRDPNTTFAVSLISFFFVLYQKLSQDGFVSFVMEFFHTFPTEGSGALWAVSWIGNILFSPLEILSRLSRIISMSFRLFGNILGGGVVFYLLVEAFRAVKEYLFYWTVIALFSWFIVFYLMGQDPKQNRMTKLLDFFIGTLFILAYAQMFFGIFEALIQSFVPVMLTMVYLSTSIHHELKNDSKGIVW